jgi:hypothetical protein
MGQFFKKILVLSFLLLCFFQLQMSETKLKLAWTQNGNLLEGVWICHRTIGREGTT